MTTITCAGAHPGRRPPPSSPELRSAAWKLGNPPVFRFGLRRLSRKALLDPRLHVPGVTAHTRQSIGLPIALPGPGELGGRREAPRSLPSPRQSGRQPNRLSCMRCYTRYVCASSSETSCLSPFASSSTATNRERRTGKREVLKYQRFSWTFLRGGVLKTTFWSIFCPPPHHNVTSRFLSSPCLKIL